VVERRGKVKSVWVKYAVNDGEILGENLKQDIRLGQGVGERKMEERVAGRKPWL
jgi:hypothetical protein